MALARALALAAGAFAVGAAFGRSSDAAGAANAANAPNGASPARATVDRIAVRFYAPETGGSARPRFITERTLAFEARLEALMDEGVSSGASYQDRYVRAAMERHVAEDMLAALMVEAGSEPPDLPHQADDARAGLIERFGGATSLLAAQQAEGIDDSEVDAILRRRVRAAFYIDRHISPILRVSDEQLREVYRTSSHPYKHLRFEEARGPLERWFLAERVRVAENAFLQSARARVKIVVVSK